MVTLMTSHDEYDETMNMMTSNTLLNTDPDHSKQSFQFFFPFQFLLYSPYGVNSGSLEGSGSGESTTRPWLGYPL